MLKNKIVVLSDIHIGTNSPTNWYQQKFHESYLSTILNYVIQNAATIQELILLGDVFDFWTYPPDQKLPTCADILNANPNIFGINGKLSQALTALQGRVTYVNGNHDINITQSDLSQIQNSSGYQIKYCSDPIYYVQTPTGKKIAFTHGHIFTLFNALDTQTQISPLPVGFFITRSVAYQLNKTLKPGQTVADLPGQGSPNGINLSGLASSLWHAISSISSGSVNLVDVVLNYIMKVTGMPENEPILLPSGQTTSIAQAKTMYKGLQSQWISNWEGGEDGVLALVKSAIADLDGTYIAWFAQESALKSGSDLIVLGHTHFPKLGLTNGFVQYANNGFECPSSPDIPLQTFTFSEVDIDNCQANLFQVLKQNSTYQISPYPASPDSVITSASSDFSCYVIIDNTNGNLAFNLTNFKNDDGHYVVTPPQQIIPGQQAKFWLQDYPGLVGSKGRLTYSAGNQSLELTYACPTSWFNSCSGANFYTSNDGANWGGINEIKKSGHPFFIKFVL